MKVYVVVLNWNGKDFVEECLNSLQRQTYKAELVVVDNGSTDGSVELIEKKYPKIHLIKERMNHGFAGGVNIGIKYAIKNNADAIALFNNDAVAKKDWLEQLVKTMTQNSSAGIITCKLMRSDKKHFDSTGDFYSIRGIPFPRGRNTSDKGQYEKMEEVFGASGGASLYRTELLNDIGLFDERFFAYYEDVDISFRAQLAGWKVVYQPKAIAYHEVSATGSKLGNFSHYHSNKNFYFLYLKNMPTKLFIKYMPSFAYQAARSAASSLVHLRLSSYLKAMFIVLLNLPSVFIDRRIIQSSKRVNAKYIDSLLIHSKPPISPEISREYASK